MSLAAGLSLAVPSAPDRACPRCPAAEPGGLVEVFRAAGHLAAHLIKAHGVDAGSALQEARRRFTEPALTAPVVAVPLVSLESPMPKRKVNKCSNCHQPGHKASTCPERVAAAATPSPLGRRKDETPRELPRAIAAGLDVGATDVARDFATTARQSAKDVIRKKVEEELAWAKAYVAELERLAGA